MYALTLWQPWAWSILHLPERVAKPVENRDWKPPPSVVGTRIALHGGKRYDASARHSVMGACGAYGAEAYVEMEAYTSRCRESGILGTVRLVGVVEERRGQTRWERSCPPCSGGRT